MQFLNFKQRKSEFTQKISKVELNLDLFDQGLSQTEDFLIYKSGTQFRIYDRTCDHNQGKLFARGSVAVCPLHGWTLDPQNAKYLDVNCAKKSLLTVSEEEIDSPLIAVNLTHEQRLLCNFTKKYQTKIQYLNHACLIIEVPGKIKFATDPWLIGPAFGNGWWLANPSPIDALDNINACDFIYISHNHPDHLHPETLALVRKDMPILTPAFSNASTEKYLRKLGFENIVTADFNSAFIDEQNEFSVSILKSGDFRDDSGILVELGQFSALLTVDSNFIDFGRIPKGITLLGSSFAGGASGFPLCFETYNEEEKKKIIARNRAAIRASNLQNIRKTEPGFFMPYAGFFSEMASRDSYIKQRNLKNNVTEYAKVCVDSQVKLLNVEEYQQYYFDGCQLTRQDTNTGRYLQQKSIETYLQETDKQASTVTAEQIKEYFSSSGFYQDLLLKIVLTNDNFESIDEAYFIEFSCIPQSIEVSQCESDFRPDLAAKKKNYLEIKVRNAEFKLVVKHKKPWEDLSIGFQCRIYREPNSYNSDFWYHFSNVYIVN